MNKFLSVLMAGLFAATTTTSVYAADPVAPAAEKATHAKSMKHSHRLAKHEAKLKEIEEKHKEHEAKLNEHEGKHKEHESKLKEHEEKIKALEAAKPVK